ncbi:MAG TPA: 2'-5' RNA ligase family protein [Streptosporangiaceae bacterium]
MDDFFATLNPWWPPGREDLHWHLLPDPAQVAAELTGPYQELTHLPGLAPVGPRWCHITVQDIGPAEAIAPAELDSLVARTRQACATVAPVELTIGPPVLARYGLVSPVGPADRAHPLWELAVAASQPVIGTRFPIRPAEYHPHLSLAYGVARTGDGRLLDWLATHPAPTMTFTATHLTLVAQSHDGARAITWRPITTVPLG